MNIQNLIPKGEWAGNGEYVIRCPFCGDSKSHNHCHINVNEKIFHCFFCGEGGELQRLFRKLGLHGVLDLEKPAPLIQGPIEQLDFFAYQSLTGIRCDQNSIMAKDFLFKRGITEEEIQRYDMRIDPSPEHKWYGRIIIPIREQERTVCVVGRAFLEFILPKYLYPHRGETLLTAGECLYTPWSCEPDYGHFMGITIVEGVFDAISCAGKRPDFFSVALLGKVMKEPQLYKLLKYDASLRFYVLLDADAPVENLRITKQLATYGRRVFIVSLKKGDPGTATREELTEALSTARPFSFDLEMELKIRRM